jgi:hypothetical protein
VYFPTSASNTILVEESSKSTAVKGGLRGGRVGLDRSRGSSGNLRGSDDRGLGSGWQRSLGRGEDDGGRRLIIIFVIIAVLFIIVIIRYGRWSGFHGRNRRGRRCRWYALFGTTGLKFLCCQEGMAALIKEGRVVLVDAIDGKIPGVVGIVGFE